MGSMDDNFFGFISPVQYTYHVAGYGVATPHILFYLTLSLTARVYHEYDTCLLFHHTQALVFESNIYAIVLERSRGFCKC